MIVFNIDAFGSYSFGVKEYFFRINRYLRLKPADSFGMNFKGLFTTSASKNVLWTPGQGGSLLHPLQVITCHDVIDFSFYRNNFFRSTKKVIHERIYKGARHIVFISDSSLEEFNRTFPSVSTERSVIKSPTIIEPGESIKGCFLDFDDFILVVTNNLQHKNNIDVFCLASLLHSRQVNFPVVVVGDVVVPARFRYLLGKSLFVFKNVAAADLVGLQSFANVILSSSLSEGHNLPIAEGLGVGANIVATDIPVHKEFYDGLVKFYVAGSIEDLCDKCMVYYPKGVSTRGKRVSLRSWEHVANDYSCLFEKIY